MDTIVKIITNREDYDIRDSAENALTIEETIEILKYLPPKAKIVFSNDNGYTFACAVLGTFYYDGEPLVSRDYAKAFNYLSKAAADSRNIGNDGLLAEVYKKLGACYRFGRGTEVDQSLASYYTEQAAKYGDQGSVDAVKMLRR